MSHRTRSRQRRLHTDPGQRQLLVAAARRGGSAEADEELTVIRIPSGGPARTYAIPAPPSDFVPYPPARHARITEPSHLTGRDDREIRFDDLPPENPHLLAARPS